MNSKNKSIQINLSEIEQGILSKAIESRIAMLDSLIGDLPLSVYEGFMTDEGNYLELEIEALRELDEKVFNSLIAGGDK
jgi:hypothetical protein